MSNFNYILNLFKIRRYSSFRCQFFICLILCALALVCFHNNTKVQDNNNVRNLKDVVQEWFETDENDSYRGKKASLHNSTLSPYNFNIFINNATDSLPKFNDDVQCPILFDNDHPEYENAKLKASNWKYNVSESEFWKELEEEETTTTNICSAIQNRFTFFTQPLSIEESDFPLAYGILAYKDIRQMIYMLSTFYQPQNAYCIAIDGKATIEFKNRMKILQQCFPNIHVYTVNGNVKWCGPEIPKVVLSCVYELNERKHPWKYYQYLSGFDLPLKTNLEMVRIFKALNGTFNSQVQNLFPERYANKGKPPLPIWVSSMSVTFSRESAKVISTHPKVYELLKFLDETYCSDESLWATIGGNPDYIKMPGGFSASEFHEKIQSELAERNNMTKSPLTLTTNTFHPQSFYISRYQTWNVKENNYTGICEGTWKNSSCIFGVGDLPSLIVRPELVAHKLYIDTHPAAFFCLYQKIRQRSLDLANQINFDASNYAKLPQVLLTQGKSLKDVKFLF